MNIKLYLGLAIGVLIFCSLATNIISWINKKVTNKVARYLLNLVSLVILLWMFLFLYGDHARLVMKRF